MTVLLSSNYNAFYLAPIRRKRTDCETAIDDRWVGLVSDFFCFFLQNDALCLVGHRYGRRAVVSDSSMHAAASDAGDGRTGTAARAHEPRSDGTR